MLHIDHCYQKNQEKQILYCTKELPQLPISNCKSTSQEMKQKIVIKVEMNTDKCRSKAMKIAAVAQGVSSVKIDGKDKDRLVVIGDGVDAVKLTSSLRKKLGYAAIESVQKDKEKDKDNQKYQLGGVSSYTNYCPRPVHYQVVYDHNPSPCSIL